MNHAWESVLFYFFLKIKNWDNLKTRILEGTNMYEETITLKETMGEKNWGGYENFELNFFIFLRNFVFTHEYWSSSSDMFEGVYLRCKKRIFD